MKLQRYLYLLLIFAIKTFPDTSLYLGYSYNELNPVWKFLPNPPNTFKSNDTESLAIEIGYKKYFLNFSSNKFSLDLDRPTEPKEINLSARGNALEFSFPLNDSINIKLSNSKQDADRQIFQCYSFGNLIVGSCNDASISIVSSNDFYDDLGNNLVGIDGSTSTKGIHFNYLFNQNAIADYLDFGITITKSNFYWKSPIEEIESPVILGLSVGGITLGDAIKSEFARLPQRSEWLTKSFDINLSKSLKIKTIKDFDISLFYNIDYKFFRFSDYVEHEFKPDINYKLRLGTSFLFKDIELKVYGDYYKNNLVGFQPITFNQRTEHYFDDPYGELGISLKYNIFKR